VARYRIIYFGTEGQRKRYLRAWRLEELVGAYALSAARLPAPTLNAAPVQLSSDGKH